MIYILMRFVDVSDTACFFYQHYLWSGDDNLLFTTLKVGCLETVLPDDLLTIKSGDCQTLDLGDIDFLSC